MHAMSKRVILGSDLSLKAVGCHVKLGSLSQLGAMEEVIVEKLCVLLCRKGKSSNIKP